MRLFLFISSVIVTFASASRLVGNSSSFGCAVQASCKSGGVEGVCVSRSSGCCAGTFDSSDLCPGSDDIQVYLCSLSFAQKLSSDDFLRVCLLVLF